MFQLQCLQPDERADEEIDEEIDDEQYDDERELLLLHNSPDVRQMQIVRHHSIVIHHLLYLRAQRIFLVKTMYKTLRVFLHKERINH